MDIFRQECKERALSNNTYDYITDYPIGLAENYDPTFCYTDLDGLYNIVYMNRNNVPGLDAGYFEYQSVPTVYGLMQMEEGFTIGGFDPTSLIVSGIAQVQRPPLSLTGSGVVICIIDTGIDYTNPVFLDENGNTRILAIWDQTIQDGTPPDGFFFGTEYTREQINEALQAENPLDLVPSRDTNGHGTAMAAVAAGNSMGGAAPYVGAAPGAQLVVVKLKECKQYLREFYRIAEGAEAYQENDIMLGVSYADQFAILFNRPVVICLGLGTNMGDHAGSSALPSYLNAVAVKRNRAVVVCGGNEGNASHHYGGRLLSEGSVESYQDVEVRVGENNSGFLVEFWGNLPDIFQVSVRSPGGESVPAVRLSFGQSITYGFVYERSRVTIQSNLVEPASGEQLFVFILQDPTPGIWTFRVTATGETHNGEFNMWLPIREFLSSEVYFLSPTPDITLTEPAMASNVISVTAYNADNNSIYIESGRGFSRVGTIRPDMAAPGVNVPTPSGARTGSSLAAALTAGAVAQFLQWAVVERNNQYAESKEIKSYFIRGATRSADTVYPNREFGYGRLNIAGVFETIRGNV